MSDTDSVRQPILSDIKYSLRDSDIDHNDQDTLLQIITDCSVVVDRKTIREVIFNARMVLHIERYKRLSIIPRRVDEENEIRSLQSLLCYRDIAAYVYGSRGTP